MMARGWHRIGRRRRKRRWSGSSGSWDPAGHGDGADANGRAGKEKGKENAAARRTRRRRVALVAAAAVVAAVVVWALLPRPLEVETAPVVRGPLRVTVDEEGQTRVRERFVVAAPLPGRLRRVRLVEGDAVAAGSVVARIESAPLDPRDRAQLEARAEAAAAAVGEAAAALDAAVAARDQTVRDLGRAERLTAAGALAVQDLETARLALATRQEEVEAAAARLETVTLEAAAARAALLGAGIGPAPPALTSPVTSPVSGQVLRVLEAGPTVLAAGTPLLEVGDPGDLEIVVDVPSEDALEVRPGQQIVLTEVGEDRVLRGVVRRVEPSAFTVVSPLGIEEQRVNVVGDFLDPPGPLGDRFRVEASIVVWEGDDVLKVPVAALFRHDGAGWAVFAVENGRARLRQVTIGRRGRDEAQILAGLVEGDQVVLRPTDELEDGARVRPAS